MNLEEATKLCFKRYLDFDLTDNERILVEEAINGKYPIDKLSRWLGYIQGCIISRNLTTVEIERNFSRPIFQKAYENEGIEVKSFSTKKNIKTSYFANYRNFGNLKPISISRFPPKGFKGEQRLDLAPGESLLKRYKEGLVSEEEYEIEYIQGLPQDIQLEDNCVLLCYEKKGDFCHRSILAKILNIEEL